MKQPKEHCPWCNTTKALTKKTGSAKKAFSDALEAGFKAWRAEMESQLSDEYIDDCLTANEYEFTEDGKRF